MQDCHIFTANFNAMQLCQLGMLPYDEDEDTIGSLQELLALIMSQILGEVSSGDKSECQALIPQ